MSTKNIKCTDRKNFAVEEIIFISFIVIIVIAVLYSQNTNNEIPQNITNDKTNINYTARLIGQSEFCYNMYIPAAKNNWNISDPYMTTIFQDEYWLTTHTINIDNITIDILIKTKCFPQFNWSIYE